MKKLSITLAVLSSLFVGSYAMAADNATKTSTDKTTATTTASVKKETKATKSCKKEGKKTSCKIKKDTASKPVVNK